MCKKVENTLPDKYVIEDLNGEEIVTFYKKEFQKTSKTKFRIENVIRRKKMINGILSGKVTVIRLILGLEKKMKYR